MERARLLYNGIAYTEDDLRKICDSHLAKDRWSLINFKVSRDKECITGTAKTLIGRNFFYIGFNELKDYPFGTPISDRNTLKFEGKTYAKPDLVMVGNILASQYCGYVEDFVIDRRQKKIFFTCVFPNDIGVLCEDFANLKNYVLKNS